jgi:hypothetical protein
MCNLLNGFFVSKKEWRKNLEIKMYNPEEVEFEYSQTWENLIKFD